MTKNNDVTLNDRDVILDDSSLLDPGEFQDYESGPIDFSGIHRAARWVAIATLINRIAIGLAAVVVAGMGIWGGVVLERNNVVNMPPAEFRQLELQREALAALREEAIERMLNRHSD